MMDHAFVQKLKWALWFLCANDFQFHTLGFLHYFILIDYGSSLRLLKLGYLCSVISNN